MDRERLADSPYNRHPQVISAFNTSPKVIINDCTLREGEQTAAANFTLEEKLEIAGLLEEAGIHQLQGGYPGRSPVDFEFVRKFKKQRKIIKIEAIAQVFQKDWKEQISRSLECGPDLLDLIYPASDLRLKYVQKVSREEMLERSLQAVEFACGQGAVIRFAPVDTTRTDFDFLMRLFKEVLAAGAEIITIADTAGAITPPALGWLVGETVSRFKAPVQVHCHNDFGLALANALAAVQAGASIIDVTVNGLGERAGNVCLDELILVLTAFYDLDLGVDTARLGCLARRLAELTRVPIPPFKPILGSAAFTHKLDAHVKGVLANPALYEVIQPEWVGNRRVIPLGKYSGPVVIRAKLAELELEAEEDAIKAIVQEVERRAADRHASLSEDQFRDIVREIMGQS